MRASPSWIARATRPAHGWFSYRARTAQASRTIASLQPHPWALLARPFSPAVTLQRRCQRLPRAGERAAQRSHDCLPLSRPRERLADLHDTALLGDRHLVARVDADTLANSLR